MMEANTKLVGDLEPGDRVLMEDGAVRIVAKVGKGFAKYRRHDGTTEPSVLIDWKDGDWSQCPHSEIATLAPAKTRTG
jgi:hypothetical protein